MTTSELETDSMTSTAPSNHPPPPPPSRWHHDDSSTSPTARGHLVRLMCSFGGRIVPRPHDHQLRYVGGDTRIVAIPRSASFATLLSKLSKIAGSSVPADQLSVKYQLPNEDLEALITLTSDEDVDNMMDEYDRLLATRTPRLRLFLFHPSSAAASSFLDRSGGSKQDDWFLDALNGSAAAPPLERGRSEASSIVSEVPDYLFGFDNNSDETPPAAAAPGQTLLSLENLSLSLSTKAEDDILVEPQINRQSSYVPNPVWQFVAEPMPVYYVPGPMMPGGSLPVHPVPMPFPYAAHQPVQGVVGNPIHGGPVYVGGTQMGYEYPAMPMYQPAGIAPAGTEIPMPGGAEFMVPRPSQ